MDKRYEVYCLTDPVFYESPARLRDEHLELSLTRAAVPPGWRRAEMEDWVVWLPEDLALPGQGWKVHVSACLDNAEDILAAVRDYCVPRAIPFKFLRGRHVVLIANAKYAHRGSSGKFVTIYPRDEAELQAVLEELGQALDGQPGPYILSDLRYGAGPLYVRYGQFADRYCISPSGEMEPAIEDADGNLVPDRRRPVFHVPAWVTLPDFLVPHVEARNATTMADLPYRIERALHFSNGGGLYVGEDLRTGDQVVFKEARPHAGLDIAGADAVTRLTRERDMLERLAGLEVVPRVHGSFQVGEHLFLALEFIEGTSLYSEIVRRYPLVGQQMTRQAAADYTAWALDTYALIERAVGEVHERGIVIGDFHAYNVLLRPDGRVALVDFEVASHVSEERRPTLAGAGFEPPTDVTGLDIDRYALACLRLFLFLPLTSLLSLDRGKAEQFAAEIAGLFPVPRPFLDQAVAVIAPPSREQGSRGGATDWSAELEPDREGWLRARASLARAVLASATPDRDDRLYPGDIEQFSSGGLNLAHGAAGVLYALAITGAGRSPEAEEWLVQRATNPEPGVRLGFYDGLHGVAYVLDHLGLRGEALKVLDICGSELDGKLERIGSDLRGGLSGIGLNLAHFAAVTGDPDLAESAIRVADLVAARLGTEESVAAVSGGQHPYAGLLRGSAGPALLFIRLHQRTGDPGWLDLAATALGQDLRRCYRREDGSLEVNEGWRTMPYLADGSVGIGMVLDEYLAHRQDERFAEAARAIRLAAEAQFYVEPGLFHGRAGMILHLSRHHAPGTAADQDAVVAAHIRRLRWHALAYQDDLAFPGEQLLRLSMDLGTGNAGILLSLGAALHDEPVHLPFLTSLAAGPAPKAQGNPHEEGR